MRKKGTIDLTGCQSYLELFDRIYADDGSNPTKPDPYYANELMRDIEKEVVDFMRDHKRFTENGARIPKGVLLV